MLLTVAISLASTYQGRLSVVVIFIPALYCVFFSSSFILCLGTFFAPCRVKGGAPGQGSHRLESSLLPKDRRSLFGSLLPYCFCLRAAVRARCWNSNAPGLHPCTCNFARACRCSEASSWVAVGIISIDHRYLLLFCKLCVFLALPSSLCVPLVSAPTACPRTAYTGWIHASC